MQHNRDAVEQRSPGSRSAPSFNEHAWPVFRRFRPPAMWAYLDAVGEPSLPPPPAEIAEIGDS